VTRANNFSDATKRAALARQQFRCALCGSRISDLGHAAQEENEFGEGAHAHHMLPVKKGGSSGVDNCVILCWSCHYHVHEGGNYQRGLVITEACDYDYFNG